MFGEKPDKVDTCPICKLQIKDGDVDMMLMNNNHYRRYHHSCYLTRDEGDIK